MAVLHLGLIGIGNMGSAHVSCISAGNIQGLELTALCDLRPERLKSAAAQCPGAACYLNWRDLIADPGVEAVLIAVPHPLHAEIAMAALKAGKHVLTEKPVDISISKAKRLNEAAEKSGKVFGIMFNQRTDPLFQKAREIVQSGQLGKLKRSVWIITNWYRTQHYYDSGTWRATWHGEGGGVLLNQCPHQLDLWQWICGMPTQVTAFCDVAKYHKIEVEDDVSIFTRYENGATGAFLTSTGEYPGTNRLELSGTLGKVVLENGLLKWWKLQQDEREVCFSAADSSPKIGCDYQEITPASPAAGHAGILQNFTDAVLHGTPLLAPGTDGIRELTLSNAAYLSAWQGNIPVSLPLDTAAFDAELAARADASRLREGSLSDAYSTAYSHRWQVQW